MVMNLQSEMERIYNISVCLFIQRTVGGWGGGVTQKYFPAFSQTLSILFLKE